MILNTHDKFQSILYNPLASEKQQVRTGKITVIVAMVLGVLIAPHLGIDKKGGFQYIQEYTGFVSPGIFAMFILGFFWRKINSAAALFATIGGFLLSLLLKFLPGMLDLSFLNASGFSVPVKQANGQLIYEIPFIDRMGLVFVFCILGMYLISLLSVKKASPEKGLDIDSSDFKTSNGFLVGALIILGLLTALYWLYW